MATIVLVDDDDKIRATMKRMIQSDGHTVIEFDDAEPVLKSIKSIKVDLIVTDFHMPTPGTEIIKILKKEEIQIPVLVVTGHIAYNKVNELLAIGATSVLLKPFTLDEFQIKINNCLLT